ncbi:hypothetical protein SAMN02745181_0374 [Rubritalea squalenifaciens DSM 18772]|uniref:Uncharacterized protein n=1 Tax=Rubritalea squalenifaciens DSM 18772 TaxID=1123071 RepID=A0A1M6C2Y9_9BACT|nr:hypothetical protein [Rubritalea squalenifaciens]SHI55379.1 hypothetical protein SAMN02745181_0374 [Rubritalea squalenifaciens DSM 18772]
MKIITCLCVPLLCITLPCCKEAAGTSDAVQVEPKVSTPAADTASAEEKEITAEEVNRFAFVEKELVANPGDESGYKHLYMGSRDDYDYFSVREKFYKIPSEQLSLKKTFTLTQDKTKWLPMRVHFSHVKYQGE